MEFSETIFQARKVVVNNIGRRLLIENDCKVMEFL